jgi:hypothetical protein
MASVRISRREAERGLLPRVCILTGEPTDSIKHKSFSWSPSWTILLILVGLLPYIIISLVLTKRMAVELPLVERKHGHWLIRQALVIGGVLIAIALACGGGILGSRDNDSDLGLVLVIAGLIFFLVVLIAGAILMQKAIRPLEITDFEIRLAGVHENFKGALLAMREDRRREKDEAEDDPRDQPRRLKARRYDPDRGGE